VDTIENNDTMFSGFTSPTPARQASKEEEDNY